MGWSMWTSKEDEKKTEVDSNKIEVKALTDNKYIIKFLKDAPVPSPHKNSVFEFWMTKSQSPRSDGIRSLFETLWSSKETNVRDFRIGYEKSLEQSDYRTMISEQAQQICDDYPLIQGKFSTITKIGIYSSYYIVGIKIEFESEDLKTSSTFHWSSNFNLEKDPKITYKELLLSDDEFIEQIIWVKSTQTNFIRNISFITNFERNLWVEGEVEIYDIALSCNRNSFEIKQENWREVQNELLQSFSLLDEDVSPCNSDQFRKLEKEFEWKSIILEGDDDDLSIRKQSIWEGYKKNQDWNLRCIQHKLLGLKTVFTKGYLEDIELYTTQNDKGRHDLIQNSQNRKNFKFV